MLNVSHLTKSFNRRSVLKDVTFHISDGETVVIMGQNGAGKSTLLRILSRIMTSDSGVIMFQDDDLLKGEPFTRKNLLYIGHAPAMYGALSAVENISLGLKLRGTPLSNEEINLNLDRFGLLNQKDDPIVIYSQGMLQRLKLAYAESAHWDLLLMDEPFAGLDENGYKQMEDVLTKWKTERKSMCLVLHNRKLAEKYGDKILYLEDGIVQRP